MATSKSISLKLQVCCRVSRRSTGRLCTRNRVPRHDIIIWFIFFTLRGNCNDRILCGLMTSWRRSCAELWSWLLRVESHQRSCLIGPHQCSVSPNCHLTAPTIVSTNHTQTCCVLYIKVAIGVISYTSWTLIHPCTIACKYIVSWRRRSLHG